MKVKIFVELLADQRNFEALDDIARCFQTGRHVWDIPAADIDAIENSAWLTSELDSRAGRRNRALFEKSAKLAVEQGMAQIDGGGEPPRRCHTRPVDIMPDEDLSACLRELEQPARIFLEDRQSDGRFIECIVRAYERTSVREALDASRGWISLEHCGGKSGIKARVEEALERSSMVGVSRARMMAMLDSDRYHPGHESESVLTAKKIETCGIPVHVLRKRETENYLPVERLVELDAQYQAARAAFARLTKQQRDHFDMKKDSNCRAAKSVFLRGRGNSSPRCPSRTGAPSSTALAPIAAESSKPTSAARNSSRSARRKTSPRPRVRCSSSCWPSRRCYERQFTSQCQT